MFRTSLLTVLLTAFGGLCPGQQPNHDAIAGKPALTATTNELKRTVVVGTYQSPMEDHKSVIWCSTMELAWNEMAGLMGGPLTTNAVGEAAKAVAAFNANSAGPGDLDEDSFVAMAGFGKDDILKKIGGALEKRFHGAASPKLLPSSVGPEDLLAYAYLFKNLEFASPFIRRTEALGFAGSGVAAFGLWPDHKLSNWSEVARQVSVLSYTSPKQWTVELKSKAKEDRLIIARLEKAPTLAETVAAALKAGGDSKPEAMNHADQLVVPLLNYDITRNYNELSGVELQGTKSAALVKAAVQNIRFRLDERGAVLKSEAVISLAAGPVQKQVREMVCDGPFLIVMMRAQAARPYFAMWVDNPEVLVRFEKK